MNEKEYNEIRELLRTWYAGETCPADELRLRELFAAAEGSAAGLPEDLKTDRTIFLEMNCTLEDTEMPERYAVRIEREISAAMRSDRMKRWRRRLMIAGAAAACAGVIWIGAGVVFNSERNADVKEGLANVRKSTVGVPAPVIATATADSPQLNVQNSASPAVPAKRKPEASVITQEEKLVAAEYNTPQNSQSVLNPADSYSSESYSYSEEEEQMLAANYHVVTSEEEAQAVFGSVFGFLDGKVAQVGARVDGINNSFNAEVMTLE